MADAARKVPSFEELFEQIRAMPEHVAAEILEPGAISTRSRPGSAHRFAQRQIQRALDAVNLMMDGRGWWLESEAEVRLGDRRAVPNMLGWRCDAPPEFVDETPIRHAGMVLRGSVSKHCA